MGIFSSLTGVMEGDMKQPMDVNGIHLMIDELMNNIHVNQPESNFGK